ncbi:MAG: DNA polymerase III subunit gamma/tau [Planctomycetaceae bacterium]
MTTGAHYTVLARRFRPQAFDDVVGQEHVARALTNAIKAGRVAHAYMFTGARGVGKTSTARILAKALNCPNAKDGVPCNHCEICDGISAGNDVDVLEIDGASNRGIDDIRSLRANVGVRSMRTEYKVYIIDEVHMLTKEAFNALLKTLEEPPPNVKFVFCTTEPNKVPDTILSRCQRFDFSSINDISIADRLREIAKIEGFEVSEDALELVARRARGSMRDSQSLFDQLLAFSDGTVSAEDVHRMLGTAGDERLVNLFNAIVEHRPGEVLAQLDESFATGVQPGELMDQAIGYVRDLMVTLSGGDAVSLCSVATRHRETLMKQAARLSMHSVMAAFQILSDGKNQMFRSTFARTVLEMAMVQLSLLENLSAISDLLSGRLPALPDMPAGQLAAPTVSASPAAAVPAGEKKNAERLKIPDITPPAGTTVTCDDDPADLSDPSDPSTDVKGVLAVLAETHIAVAPEIELTQENCPALFQKLLSTLGLTISAGFKQANGIQLGSENRLEILLDSTSDFARKALDQADNRSRIEAEILRLTGRTVSIALRLTAPQKSARVTTDSPPPSNPVANPKNENSAPSNSRSPRSEASPPAPAPLRNLMGEIDPTSDLFVRQVIQAFGATVVRITAAPAVQVATTESDDSDE